MTCPVAKEAVDGANQTKRTALAQKKKSSTPRTSKMTKETVFKTATVGSVPLGFPASRSSSLSTQDNNIKTELEPDLFHDTPLSNPAQQQTWPFSTSYQAKSPQSSVRGSICHSQASSLDSDWSLPHLRQSTNEHFDDTVFPGSASSMNIFPDTYYTTPINFSQTSVSLQYTDPFPTYPGDTCSASEGDSSVSALGSVGPFFESSEDIPLFPQEDADAVSQYAHEYEPMGDMEFAVDETNLAIQNQRSMHLQMTVPQSLSFSRFFHLPSRMQYLLSYYDQHICSVLVAFDSPGNPYRQHVLELATLNEGLQNAIAALAINNMRMRNEEQTHSVGFIEELTPQGSRAKAKMGASSRPSPEESFYKTVSINQLQMQLSNPRNAQDDSILATLLILCLFHVCDSGFSKFKTQLEGVQKLLSMRDASVRTGFIGWVEMFFTWFDVMTSTVNDRETAIRGDRLDMMQYSSNLGALEEFSGCDGRLFKLIARLGRLNLLSQDKPVRSERDGQETPRPSTPLSKSRASAKPFGPSRWQKRKPIDPMDFTKLDGNGWGTPIVSPGHEEDEASLFNQTRHADARHEFWLEWNDIRARLKAWSMKTSNGTTDNGSMEATEMGPEQRDMIHINESFRSSALLYTERLAHPHLPSSSLNFQEYVRNALEHITSISVTSCVNKFLLWPLFIAGTECVDVNDRANVRERCLEIKRESGFYNNLSVLDVLERVWAEQGEDTDGGKVEEVIRRRKDSTGIEGGFGQAFRWRKAMNRVDGEYIIV